MTVGLLDLTLLTSKDVVLSRRKTLWTMIRGMFKLRSIWMSSASSSDWSAIFSLISKSSSFLGALLPEIEVNGVLLSIVNEVEEGGLFWRVAFSRFSRRLFRTNCTQLEISSTLTVMKGVVSFNTPYCTFTLLLFNIVKDICGWRGTCNGTSVEMALQPRRFADPLGRGWV